MLFHIHSFHRRLAVLLLLTISVNLFFPPVAKALTGGPGQPEFSSFESVGTTNMVNEFTGDFTYNLPVLHVPGPQGSGYSLSLAYQSGATPEEEASWVGHGWTLSPGAIIRNTRGLPDDYKGQVTYHNKMEKNWTAAVEFGAGQEAISFDKFPIVKAGVKSSLTFSYNNNIGFGISRGIGLNLGIASVLNLGANVRDGDVSYTAGISPGNLLWNKHILTPAQRNNASYSQLVTSFYARAAQRVGSVSYSFAENVKPTGIQEYTGHSTMVSTNIMFAPVQFPVGATVNVNGTYSYQYTQDMETKDAFGYMYAGHVNESKKKSIQDYYIEKDTPYRVRDVNIGIPFNNADNFFVSGEGIGGGFRVYHKQIGEFYPADANSKTTSLFAGVEVTFGATIGLGEDIVGGSHTLSTGKWLGTPKPFSAVGQPGVDEPVFFRMNNDLGGWKDDKGIQGTVHLKNEGGIPGSRNFSPVVTADHLASDEPKRAVRSTYVGYNVNKDIRTSTKQVTSHKAYTKRADIEALTDRVAAPDGIGEFAITTETGQQYLYGLPLYNRNESSIMYGAVGAKTDDNYLIYHNREDIKVGQDIKDKPFANTFLLTQTTTPDYVDRTLNGPTEDDFGGYTVFHYEKLYGYGSGANEANWYKWRIPYNGLLYHKNAISDPRDDMGSVSEGEKEIALLKYIKTKTHIAFFITGIRSDGHDAPRENARTSKSAKGSNPLKKLERIDLYLLSDIAPVGGKYTDPTGKPYVIGNKKPIKTVRFEYNGQKIIDPKTSEVVRQVAGPQAWPGIPNGETSQTGKLTLNKVWFEYNGIEGNKISPYKFEYTYPNPVKYAGVYETRDLATHSASLLQDPVYNVHNLDAWGNYQADGKTRYSQMQNWLSQKPQVDFDPAAWQLKVIKLPTGGEIHVQYEQDDYAYVQDKPAHTLVNLVAPTAEDDCLQVSGRKRYKLDLSQSSTTPAEVLTMIQENYLAEHKKMYFRFLYNLSGEQVPNLNMCSADYVTGYVSLSSAGICAEDGQVYVELQEDLPQKICREYAKVQVPKLIRSGGQCNPAVDGINAKGSPVEVVKSLVKRVTENGFIELLTSPNTCLKLSYQDSYFKIPYPGDKKGGGLRVKRLLTYDRGLDGTPVLYGNEYEYKVFDDLLGKMRSSGVAINEPTAIREENALVENKPRKRQSGFSEFVAGEDLTIAEDPLGETVLPAASVGYARVTVKNIHSNNLSGTGYTVKDYLTARIHPSEVDAAPLEIKKDRLPTTSLVVYSTSVDNAWAVQNFSVILNSMHGQPLRVATYAGQYDASKAEGGGSLASMQEYEYFEPGEKIPVVSAYGSVIEQHSLGKEVDITMAHRAVKDRYNSTSLELDLSALLYPVPIGYPSAFLSLARNEADLYTYATSRVIRYPAVVKKVTTLADGVKTITEHLAFDKSTGAPVMTRTTDNVKGYYTSWESLGRWAYPQLGAKAETERAVFDSLVGVSLKTNGPAGDYLDFGPAGEVSCHPVLQALAAGDLLLLNDSYIGHINAPNAALNTVRIYKATAVPQLVNNLASNTVNRIEVLRSGKTNQVLVKNNATLQHAPDERMVVPQLTKTDRFLSSAGLEKDLNEQLSNSSASVILLSQQYNGVNASRLQDLLEAPDKLRAASLSIRNIRFVRRLGSNGSFKLELVSFDVIREDKSFYTVQ